MTRFLVLTNADAGSHDESAVASALAVLRRAADVEVSKTATVDELDAVLAEVDGRTLVVAGGDGTIHLVVNRLHAREELGKVPIGIIPLGTGNDLAGGVGLPREPDEAAAVIVGGHEQPMDVLAVRRGTVVVNAVHVGIGSDAAQAAQPWKERFGRVGLGKVGYLVGALIAGFTSEGLHLRVEVDEAVVADGRRRVLQLGISNGALIGGGTALAPSADPGDGRADVTVSFAVGRWDRFQYGVRLRRGTHEERHDVRSLRATKVRVSGEEFWCNSDGELTGPMRECSWHVEPGAFRLLTPPVKAMPDGLPDASASSD